MKYLRILMIALVVLIPLTMTGIVSAQDNFRDGKIEWFIDDINRLDNAEDFHSDIASVWPGEKIPDSGYLLPGSQLMLQYRGEPFKHLTMLAYSPDGQIIPLFVNKYMHRIPTKNPNYKYKFNLPPVEGRGAVVLIAGNKKLDKETVGQVVKNPDADSFPDGVDSVTFCHFLIKDYVNSGAPDMPYSNHEGYNTPYQGQQGYNQGNVPGAYNQKRYYYSSPNYYNGNNRSYRSPQQDLGIKGAIPLSDLGPTYYFYPNGYISKEYNPHPYYFPYYYNRPMYYGYPGGQQYSPQGQRYYIIPGDNGVRTNLQDFIFNANCDYGSFTFGEDGYLGGKFFFDGSNPSRDGMTFRFPSTNTWEHEGPDGSWTRQMPSDFDFYLNGQIVPIYGGGNDPFISIPLQGFLMNGLNEFRLLPSSNPNIYGIGPIEIIMDVNF